MARRISVMLYGIVCYVVFFVTFLYLFGFMGDMLVPKSVSMGASITSGTAAILINLGLIALFGIQHSLMARPTFKRWWTKWIPPSMERSTYVLIASGLLVFLYWGWQPIPTQIWNVSKTTLGDFLTVVFLLGLVVVLASSFMINHFDLFGLRQTYLYFRGKPYTPMSFKVTGFYQWVRNPLMLGFLLSLWSAPIMTISRLLFAAGMTVYIFIGIYFEERNIAEGLGDPYLKYRLQTSMIIPLIKQKAK
jgi:protein-S-isoprenylcysteine O-methyltransferase Ste14